MSPAVSCRRSALQWEVQRPPLPSDCHAHTSRRSPASPRGSFNGPDHEYPSFLELRLTVTDTTGATGVTAVELHPLTTTLNFATNVGAALQLTVNGATSVVPFSRTVIIGSGNSLNAVSPQLAGGLTYTFNAWSDALPQLHQVTAPATPTTYTASYSVSQPPTQTTTFQVAAGSDDANQQGTAITTDAATVFLGNGSTSQVNTTGFRFAGVSIPSGATVTAATLEVTAASNQWNSMSFEVAAEASVNSPPFSAASGPGARPLLAPRATHSSDTQWLANTWYPVSNQLAPLVQAVVAQPGWASGGAVSLILRGTDLAWARKWVTAFEGTPARAARLIVTYTVPPSGPSISINDVTIAEGNAGSSNAVFTVALSAAPGATPVTVNYATGNGTAVAPGDYTATSGSLSFAGTTTAQTISVPIVGDTVAEAIETFTMTLSGAAARVDRRRHRDRHHHQRRCRAADAFDRPTSPRPKATAGRRTPVSWSPCRHRPAASTVTVSYAVRQRHRRRAWRFHRGHGLRSTFTPARPRRRPSPCHCRRHHGGADRDVHRDAVPLR